MSNLPPLPGDVWLRIIEKHASRMEDRLSLASTSRFYRELTLPIVFRRLSFTAFHIRNNDTEKDGVLASSDHVAERIKFLHSKTNIRFYVREVVINGWYDTPHWVTWDELEDMLCAGEYACGAIESLLPALPRLRKLWIWGSGMSPKTKIFSRLPQLLHLESLDIRDNPAPRGCIAGAIPDSRPFVSRGNSHGLNELIFHYHDLFNNEAAIPYLSQLLSCGLSFGNLTRLSVYHWCLPRISAANINLTFLLSVEVRCVDGQLIDMDSVYRLLAQSQDVQELRVMSQGALNSSSNPPHTGVLPRLECITGPIDVLCALVPGRPVRQIKLIAIRPPGPLELYPLQHSEADITALTLHADKLSEEELRQCGHVFKKLQHLFKKLRHFTLQVSTPSPQFCMVRSMRLLFR